MLLCKNLEQAVHMPALCRHYYHTALCLSKTIFLTTNHLNSMPQRLPLCASVHWALWLVGYNDSVTSTLGKHMKKVGENPSMHIIDITKTASWTDRQAHRQTTDTRTDDKNITLPTPPNGCSGTKNRHKN